MESVLGKWFEKPKTLNFVAPEIPYPFKFKNLLAVYNRNQNKITILILKHHNWIIGYASILINSDVGLIFHLFIEPKYRRKNLGIRLIKEIEDYGIISNVQSFKLKIQKKNRISYAFFLKLGYKEIKERKSKFIKMSKSIKT